MNFMNWPNPTTTAAAFSFWKFIWASNNAPKQTRCASTHSCGEDITLQCVNSISQSEDFIYKLRNGYSDPIGWRQFIWTTDSTSDPRPIDATTSTFRFRRQFSRMFWHSNAPF